MRTRLTALLVPLVFVLAGCGDDSRAASDSPSDSASVTVEGGSGSVTATGDYGDEPEVEVDGEFEVDNTAVEVMVEGDGEKVTEAGDVKVDYVGVNGRSGEVFDSSFERGSPTEFNLGEVVPGFSKGLTGQLVGSRVLISVASRDGYAAGNPSAGIEVGDTIVFVVDLLDPEV